jgi:hypothetical protein
MKQEILKGRGTNEQYIQEEVFNFPGYNRYANHNNTYFISPRLEWL